jgi:glutamyl/glutaminyl-tRNA synthetase
MSKRHGDTATTSFQKDYLPEAIINFLGTLSYTFSKEILTKEEMIEEFDLAKVHRSGAVFDVKKLDWLNSQYIKKLSNETFRHLSNLPELPDRAVPLITERLGKLGDVQNFNYFWEEPHYDSNLLDWKNFSRDEIKNSLSEVVRMLIEHWDQGDLNKDVLRLALDNLGKKLGDRGLVYWPFRVALTGREKSPDPVDVAFVLGKEKTLERVEKAMKKIISL